MEDLYGKLLEDIIQKKIKIRNIRNEISDLEHSLLTALIHDGRTDMLQINYSRLHHITKVTPFRYR